MWCCLALSLDLYFFNGFIGFGKGLLIRLTALDENDRGETDGSEKYQARGPIDKANTSAHARDSAYQKQILQVDSHGLIAIRLFQRQIIRR
jgi:hypothetical protein